MTMNITPAAFQQTMKSLDAVAKSLGTAQPIVADWRNKPDHQVNSALNEARIQVRPILAASSTINDAVGLDSPAAQHLIAAYDNLELANVITRDNVFNDTGLSNTAAALDIGDALTHVRVAQELLRAAQG
jgi:hypothetical protein